MVPLAFKGPGSKAAGICFWIMQVKQGCARTMLQWCGSDT
jgi:hypothetical protein